MLHPEAMDHATPFQRFIKWCERHARTDVRYILRGGFWLFGGQVTGVATALILAVIYSHYLSKEVYGTYKYIISIFGILSLFTMTGMDGAVQKGVARGNDGVFWVAFRYRVLGAIGATLAAGGFGAYYWLSGNTLLATLFFVSAPFLVIMDPLGLYGALLVGKKDFRSSTVYMLLLQISTAGAIIAAVILSKNILVIVLAYVISNVIFRAVLFVWAVRTHPLNHTKDPESLAFGKHWSFMAMLGTLASRLDAILLFHFLGPIPLAIYSFAQAATNNIRTSFKLITDTLAFPKFAGQDKELLKKTLLRKVYLAHLITIPLALVAIVFIPYLYYFLFPAYLESIPYAQVMTAFLAFSPLRFVSTAINAQATPKAYYVLALTNTLVGTASLAVCIPLWGIWGAIFAMGIQQSIGNAVGFYIFKRM